MKIRAVAVAIALPIALAGAQAPQSPIQLQHVDVTNMDTSVSPCDNFYQYVCGKMNAANPIPPDQVFWGVGAELEEWNNQILRGILEKNEAASASRTPNEQKIGDFYASCVNQATEKKDELPVIQPLLARIDGMHDKREIAAVLAAMHSSFDPAWQGNDNQTSAALFGYGQQADYNDVNQVVAGLDQGGLGMPNRDFYLKDDDQSKKIRGDYVKWIEALLGLAGASQADAAKDATTILRIETTLAKGQMDNITRRDPNKTNNRFTLSQLKTLVPNFDWDAYMSAIDSPAVPLYEVTSLEFFRALNQQIAAEDLDAWKTYLRWHLLRKASSVLGNRWRDADFAFQSVLLGEKEQPPTWRRCANAVDRNLGEALGQVYVAQVFPAESKARAKQLVKDIESAMGRNIDSVTWMQASTKREAHLKLAAVIDKIGYPDKWIDYSSLSITRDSYAVNQERSNAFELKRQLAFIGHPLDRTQWQMTPPTVDAYEDPQTNTINFPAGILQPAYFDPTQDDVINYGAEGAIVGHELTHDFDDQGRKFDVKGNLRDWWTAEDAKEYEQRGECIAKEYTGPVQGISGVEQNGKLTQGEDTADNGGLYLALSALNEDLKQQGKTIDDKDAHGLTNLQRFFIAYGTAWCDQIRPEAVKTLIPDQSSFSALGAGKQRGGQHAGIRKGVQLQIRPADGSLDPMPRLVIIVAWQVQSGIPRESDNPEPENLSRKGSEVKRGISRSMTHKQSWIAILRRLARLGLGLMTVGCCLTCEVTMAQQQPSGVPDAPSPSVQSQTGSQPTNPLASGVGLVLLLERKSLVFPDLATNRGRLNSWGKFKLAANDSVSLSTVGSDLLGAAYGQAIDSPSGYGQGGSGYGKRFGSGMARSASDNFFGTFLIASILHEDPRFYVKRDLTFTQAVKYSAVRLVLTRSDSAKPVVNYAGLLGPLAAEVLANTYWPEQNRGVGSTAIRYASDLGWRFGGNLLRQYWPQINRKLKLAPSETDSEIPASSKP